MYASVAYSFRHSLKTRRRVNRPDVPFFGSRDGKNVVAAGSAVDTIFTTMSEMKFIEINGVMVNRDLVAWVKCIERDEKPSEMHIHFSGKEKPLKLQYPGARRMRMDALALQAG
jgi:hypothetical protein